jgi:predicted secreted protein
MNLTRSAGCFALAGFVALTGCSGAEDGVTDDVINTTPASLAEANAEMDKIDRIMAESGATPELVEQQQLIRDRIDVFSGLVDRIEIAPGHSVNFFVGADGEVFVNERMKVGDRSVMQGNSAESMAALYARLAPGRAIPAALENAPALQGGELLTGPNQEGDVADSDQNVAASDIASVQSAITDSAEDGLWFVANHCNTNPGGTVVYRGACVIDKVGGRYTQATADHAQVSVAYTRGTGSIFLRRRPSEGGKIEREVRILVDEVHWVWWVGPWKDVRDSGCLPWPFACGTHREAQQQFKRWSIEEASGKKYDMSSVFYNKPLSWNGP